MQVGNGNFAFGVDITGLQTFLPYNTLSSWGWHNSSLPTTPGQTSPADFIGLDWWTHGRLVNYDQPNPAENEISNWLIQNPQRINLGRIGLWFGGRNVTEANLSEKLQTLDLYSGQISSTFVLNGSNVRIETNVDPRSDSIAIKIHSNLLAVGRLGVFFDYPYSDRNKFDAPFAGNWSAVSSHTTSLQQRSGQAVIQHDTDATTYYTALQWKGNTSITGPIPLTHRYLLTPRYGNELELVVNFASTRQQPASVSQITTTSKEWWADYWDKGAFIDLIGTSNASAIELQRRIILSQYLLAVNEAGNDPPQESGLTNNCWYGKFHLEMYLWHSFHWALWGRWNVLERSVDIYKRFLPTSLRRAQAQGYKGPQWGKMSDPSGRSAPGEINSLLIWQQPHLMFISEMEYRAFPNNQTLQKWDDVLTATAEFMASYAFWNDTTSVYDLGPPMYTVSENTNPNATINPAFELAYWRFGLDIAMKWKERQVVPVPSIWQHVHDNLAPLPIVDDSYAIYEGVPDMWLDPTTRTDHPAMIGIYGLLPAIPNVVNRTIVANTASRIWESWDFANLYGWDFPLLAMNAARFGDREKAIELLLDKNYQFDDVGMPVGGSRVPTPYFPAAGGLLMTVGMMAGGWDGESDGAGEHGFPDEWEVKSEGFSKVI